ncbi:MAG: leucine-rich repeat domain-containing protein [archaeon]|nr:leucine-rich repeat domain-containing protein [archaeon]
MHSSSKTSIIAAILVITMVSCTFFAATSAAEDEATEYRFYLANTVDGEDSTINGWYTATGNSVIEAFCNALDTAEISYKGFKSTDSSIYFSSSKTISNWTTAWNSSGENYLGANYAIWNYNQDKGWYKGNTFGTDKDTVYYISHENYLNVDGAVATAYGIDSSKVWPAPAKYDLLYDGVTGGYADALAALKAWYKESYGLDDVADYGLYLDEESTEYDDADMAAIYWMIDIDMSAYKAPAGWDISGAQYGYAQMAPLDSSAEPDDLQFGPMFKEYLGSTNKFTCGTGSINHTGGWDQAKYDANSQVTLTFTVTSIPAGPVSDWNNCGTATLTSITFKDNASLVYIPSYIIYAKSVYFKVTDIADDVVETIVENGFGVVLPKALKTVDFGFEVIGESTYTDGNGNVVTYIIDETGAVHNNGYMAYTMYGYATENADAKYCEQGTIIDVVLAEGQTSFSTSIIGWSKNPMVSSDNMISGSFPDMIGTVVSLPKNFGLGLNVNFTSGTGSVKHNAGSDSAKYDANTQTAITLTTTSLTRIDSSDWNNCGTMAVTAIKFKDNSNLVYIPSYVIYKINLNGTNYNVFYKVTEIASDVIDAINERGVSVVLPKALRDVEFGSDVTIVTDNVYTDAMGNTITYTIDETSPIHYTGYTTYTLYAYATENADPKYCEQGTIIDVDLAEGNTEFGTSVVNWSKSPMVSSDYIISGAWADMTAAVVSIPKNYDLGLTNKFTSGTGTVKHNAASDSAKYDANSQTTLTFTITSLPRIDCSDWEECGTVTVTDIAFKTNSTLVYIPSYVIYKINLNGTNYNVFYKVNDIARNVIEELNGHGMSVVLPQALRSIDLGTNVTVVDTSSYTDRAGNVVTYHIDETGAVHSNGFMAYTLYGYATENADPRYCEQGTVVYVEYAEGQTEFSTALVGWSKSPMACNDTTISGSFPDMIGSVMVAIDLPTDTGFCGDNVVWAYHEDGTLVISGDGEMFDKNSSARFSYFKYRSDVTTVVIKGNVTHIGEYAFSFFYNLENVIIGDSVTSIGKQAFNKCYAIEYISVGKNVADVDKNAFHCVNLYYLNGAKVSMSAIAGLTFNDVDGKLVSVLATGIAGDEVGWTLNFETGKLYVYGNGAMFDYAKKSDASYYKFKDCITSVEIKGGVTYVGERAFYGYALDSIVIGDSVLAIGSYAFWKVYDVEFVSFGNGLETLGYHAFSTKFYNENGKAVYSASKIVGNTYVDGHIVA